MTPNCRGFPHRKTTLGTNSLDERSARRREFFLNNAQIQKQRDVHVIGVIRNLNPTRRSVKGQNRVVREYWFRGMFETDKENNLVE